MSTVEVTRRMSEERDMQPHQHLPSSTDDKERRLQRWRDRLGPRDEADTAVVAASGASAVKARRDRNSRVESDSQVCIQVRHRMRTFFYKIFKGFYYSIMSIFLSVKTNV